MGLCDFSTLPADKIPIMQMLMRPVAIAVACLFVPTAHSQPIGLPKLAVDPALLAPAEAPPPGDQSPPPAPATPPPPAPSPQAAPAAPLTPSGFTPTGEKPVVVEADRIEGIGQREVRAEGNAILRQDDQSLSADLIIYHPPREDVFALGNVVVQRGGNVVRGPRLEFNLESQTGQMEAPVYQLELNNARGDAQLFLFEGENRYRAKRASYTTCPVNRDDWYLRVADLEIDRNANIGVARNVWLEFQSVPILYSPYVDFPLGKERKSGFLPPVIGTTTQGGAEVTLPYYWNIAPNRDATIAPRVIARRGLMLANELRYLERGYHGEAKVDVLPDDQVSGRDRWALLLQHAHAFSPQLGGAVNFQRVSDDNYFRDLASSVTLTSQTNLPQEGMLSYAGEGWTAIARAQKYQTLQDPLAPITPPYDRLPQLAVQGLKPDVLGADLGLNAEAVRFEHPTLVTGGRLVAYPTLSYPMRASFAYLAPKAGLHYTRYDLDRSGPEASPSRSVPIGSVDAGLFLERHFSAFGQRFLQTLEPRLFYVYVPFRDQDRLPNFDSADADFNFAQIFTENRFTGSDRIGDANQVTVALTSRLLEPDSGAERLRFALGQRFRFEKPRVQLASPISPSNRSDLLASLGGQLTQSWLFDASMQWNPSDNETEKLNFYARYHPAPGKVANVGYRFTRNALEQVDVSAQWPLGSRWQGVMRYNYSLRESRVLDALAGLEYDAGCWSIRFVAHRIATAVDQASNAFFVQLEFTGLGKIGADPLHVLRSSIPGFTEVDLYREQPAGER
ncbi:MAG: LPS-assembly protein LptD [Burkholderiales bacterium]|nr:MAG: LPS-assembly protein LptD [Burkholderiales bacterium]